MPSPTQNAAISCYQRQKNPHNLFSYTLIVPLSLPLLKSSSTFSVWPFHCAKLLLSAGSCYSGAARQQRVEGFIRAKPSQCWALCMAQQHSHQSSPTTPCHTGELLLQDTYPLGMSCWEPEAPEIFLNLLSQLRQQKHLTFQSKSIQGSFSFPFFFLRTCLHNSFTVELFKSASRGRAVESFWL